MQAWTIQRLLNWVASYFTDKGVDSPRLSAELLLSHVLGLKRIELYTHFDRVVDQQQLSRLRDLVKRAAGSEPLAYLIGRTEFYSLEIDITPACMIPRPETELLVERAVAFLRARHEAPLVCDLCTGSGCIAVAIAKNCPAAKVIATDISDAALDVAAANIEKHNLRDRITVLCGDLFEPLLPQLDAARFDLVVCNPPYVSEGEFAALEKSVREYEPKLALLGGADGLDVYRRVVGKVDAFLKPGGALMLEIGYAQGPAVRQLIEQAGVFGQIRLEKDFHDNDRIVTARKVVD